MCIHPKVSKIESTTRLNEVCLDMNSKTDKKCSFSDSSSQELFKDHNLVKIRDIEELVSLGKKISSCPYYGTRKSVPYAHIVVMPYNSLIHKQTREALGIKLENCVVIIDESHNLVESIMHTHSSQVSNGQFQKAFTYLTSYFEKYKNRLKPKNQNRIKQLISLLKQFIKYLNEKNQKESKILSMNDFLFELEIDNINMFPIGEFIEKSEIAKKLNGFIEKTTENQESATSCIHQVTAFLLALTNYDKDGKVHIECSSTSIFLF
jgi:chromosome transmission fidelity protein 1